MNVVDEVKERLDIADVVGKQVHLEKSGRYLKGLCPFHTEKTPSFYVFPENQRWHCFGCGRGGDIYNFVMEASGFDFRTALEELARQANVPLREQSPQEIKAESEAERLRALLEEAIDYYHTLLMTAPQAEPARAYLRKRGFKRGTLEDFRVGYSLDAWDAGRTYLLGKGYSVEEQIRAGMLVERDGGGTYDRFRDRLMIPIHDRRGRPIAFGARVLQADQQPKYMNSPQTPLFDKSQVLFGYHMASQAIRDADAAIIVEGYMDVMIPHQAGYRNVVAPMGTALSEAHLKQLQRLTHRYILALDPDSAGVHGTLQGLETARQTLDRDWGAVFDPRGMIGVEGRLKADIRIITLPEGLDPDELILQNPRQWEALVAGSQPVVRFFFQHMLSQGNPDEPKMKSRIVDAMLPLLNDIADSIEREAYAQEIALQLGLDPRTLMDRLTVMERTEAVRVQAAVREMRQTQRPPSDLEAYVLMILMHYPHLHARVDEWLGENHLTRLNDDDFPLRYRLIWTTWLDVSTYPELELDDFLPSDMLELVREWMSQPLPEMLPAQWERDVIRTVLRIREKSMLKRCQELRQDMGMAQQEQNAELGKAIKQRINQMLEQLIQVQRALAQRPAQS